MVVADAAKAALADLVELASEPAGACFRLADLQLHTPVDKNFRPGAPVERPEERAAFARRYVQAAIDRGLAVLGITEHNDVTWIDELRAAASGLDLLIFPGFEVASSDGVHVLCLFEPDAQALRLEELLVEMGLPRAERWHADGSPCAAKLSMVELVEFVQGRNGLCILAHVDRDDGVLVRLEGEPRVRAWQRSAALAVQCSKNPRCMEDGFHRLVLSNQADLYRRARAYACIQTSDARSVDEIGAKPTFVKMSSDSLEGLRQAFGDPESRIRFPDEHDVAAYPKILAARWDGSFLDAAMPLNPNLNCLVGGKGTAKSTAIETIRYAFSLEIPSQGVREQATTLLDAVFTSSAKLSLLVEVAEPRPTRYVIERTGRDPPLVRSAETGEILDGLAPTDLFRPVVFGQKEMYEMALQAESQLTLLDRYCTDELALLDGRQRELVALIEAKSGEIRRAKSGIEADADRVSELASLRERKRLFDQAGLAEKLSEQRQLERERALLATAEERIDNFERIPSELRRGVSEIPGLGVPDETPNRDLLEQLAQTLSSVAHACETAAATVEEALASARERADDLRGEWNERFETRRASFEAAVREVAGEFSEDEIQTYLGLDAKIAELSALEEQVARRRSTLSQLAQTRRELVAELRETRRQIYSVRQEWATKLSVQLDGTVRIRVEHQGHRLRALDELRKLKSGAIQKQLEQMVARPDFSPARFAELAREGATQLADQLGLAGTTAQQLLRALDDSRVDAFETLPLDDRVEIALNVGTAGRPDFRPLDRLSAGQRSTALLLLALLESDGPLILDQPEDDLDNRFVYEDVVPRLRAAKERRQFLIATHNANIPVLGDAEQIVILDVDAAADVVRARVAFRGSIDTNELHGPLEDVLEGGREAFERRKEKYGF